jgi:hypothetical protein
MAPSSGSFSYGAGLWQGYPVRPRDLLALWPLSLRGRMVSQSVGQASSGQAVGENAGEHGTAREPPLLEVTPVAFEPHHPPPLGGGDSLVLAVQNDPESYGSGG